MRSRELFHEALTRLTRLAQSKGERKWLQEALEGRVETLAEVALDVAVETGDPIGQVRRPAAFQEHLAAALRNLMEIEQVSESDAPGTAR